MEANISFNGIRKELDFFLDDINGFEQSLNCITEARGAVANYQHNLSRELRKAARNSQTVKIRLKKALSRAEEIGLPQDEIDEIEFYLNQARYQYKSLLKILKELPQC